MRTIKIAFADFWGGFLHNWDFITPVLRKHFNIMLYHWHPDVLFASTMKKMWQQEYFRSPKIMFIFEDHALDGYGASYTFSWGPDSEKNFYFPEWFIHCLCNTKNIWRTIERPKLNWGRPKFCSYVISNPNPYFRDKIFHELMKYKIVLSYGEHLRNDHSLANVKNGVPGITKEIFFKEVPHKFALVAEHTSVPGLCSEKLMFGFQSGSIPIYWGDPNVEQYFNPEAFINGTGKTPEEIAAMVIEIDQDDEKFRHMVNAPVFTDKQKENFLNRIVNFETVLIREVKKVI